jgi:hypothetical protein
MSRSKILNPATGKMVFADGAVGQRILSTIKESQQERTKKSIPNDVLRNIGKFANADTKNTLKQTNKFFYNEYKNMKTDNAKTKDAVQTLLKDLINQENAYYTFETSKRSIKFMKRDDKLVISDLGMDKSDVPKVLAAFPAISENVQLESIGNRLKKPAKKKIETIMQDLQSIKYVSINGNEIILKNVKDWPEFVTKATIQDVKKSFNIKNT